jgi:hypothetical protein
MWLGWVCSHTQALNNMERWQIHRKSNYGYVTWRGVEEDLFYLALIGDWIMFQAVWFSFVDRRDLFETLFTFQSLVIMLCQHDIYFHGVFELARQHINRGYKLSQLLFICIIQICEKDILWNSNSCSEFNGCSEIEWVPSHWTPESLSLRG